MAKIDKLNILAIMSRNGVRKGKTIMRMIKKITPLIFLFSTVFGLNSTVSQVFETLGNICIKNPVLTYATSSMVGGAVGGIAVKLLDTLEKDKEKKTTLTELAHVFSELVLYSSLVSIVGFGSQNLRNAIPQETAVIMSFITVPLYFASLCGTFHIIDKLVDIEDVQNEHNETIEKE
jgi:hypothetical protein